MKEFLVTYEEVVFGNTRRDSIYVNAKNEKDAKKKWLDANSGGNIRIIGTQEIPHWVD